MDPTRFQAFWRSPPKKDCEKNYLKKKNSREFSKMGIFNIFNKAYILLVSVTWEAQIWSHLEPGPHPWEIDFIHRNSLHYGVEMGQVTQGFSCDWNR